MTRDEGLELLDEHLGDVVQAMVLAGGGMVMQIAGFLRYFAQLPSIALATPIDHQEEVGVYSVAKERWPNPCLSVGSAAEAHPIFTDADRVELLTEAQSRLVADHVEQVGVEFTLPDGVSVMVFWLFAPPAE